MSVLDLLLNKDMFPTPFSMAIFFTYMGLFVSQGLLVTASRHGDNTYPYNPTTVVLITEILKLVLSSVAYIKNHSVTSLFHEVYDHSVILAYYMIPAFLYCLYNNLSFTNLAFFDPTSYFMFMQIRLLMTGVIYQFLFKRKLSRKQWISLLLVTLGCMIQKMDLSQLPWSKTLIHSGEHQAQSGEKHFEEESSNTWSFLLLGTGFIFILVQVCCSVFAGVYNEYLIKHIAGSEVDIMIQNVFMYLDSIVCNLVVLGLKGDLSTAFNSNSLASINQTVVIAIIVNNSLVGIVTSLFLKNLNSILKSFASALELIFTAILSFLLLAIPIYVNTVVAVAIVSYAVVLYAQNPVKSASGGSGNAVTTPRKDVVINVQRRESERENLLS